MPLEKPFGIKYVFIQSLDYESIKKVLKLKLNGIYTTEEFSNQTCMA